jgi:hypothetical protein
MNIPHKLVTVPHNAFNFCKWSVSIMLWVALFLRLPWLIAVVFIFLVLSALFKIQRAPLIWLYGQTIEKILPSKPEVLDENAMRFAHTLGAFLAICALGLLSINITAGWVFVFFYAIVKTAGVLGFCAAQKLYSCATNGNSKTCCKILKRNV